MVSCQYVFCAAAAQLSCDRQLNQEIGFTKFGTESGWPSSEEILAGYIAHNYYMPGTTTKLSMPFQVLVLWLHLKYSS